jgi:branched-chain amino acid transport system substrate-binding protein
MPMLTRIHAAAAFAATLLLAGAAAAQAPFRIAVLEDLSGVYADLTKANPDAVRLAVEDFGGKVLGRPIEVLAADHQNKADIASTIARKWYDVEDVKLVTGLGNFSIALAVQKVAEEKKKANIVVTAATTDLTGKACTPYSVHWTYDTYALAQTIGNAVVKSGGDSWFFLTADYAFGHALERDVANLVKTNNGKVLGQVRHPLATQDFSSFLLQAQASKAKIIGLANAGGDTINSIKQAAEFGITKGGAQQLAGLLVFITDVHALTLPVAQGLFLAESFYWDLNDETRAWTKRFRAKNNVVPSMLMAGAYGATLHYLKAVQAAGTDDAEAVVKKMKELPVNDFYTKDGKIREDGRVIRNMYLFQVKAPAESKGEFDYYKLVGTVPGDQAFRPLKDGGCPHVKS